MNTILRKIFQSAFTGRDTSPETLRKISCFWRCGTKICGLQILRLKPYRLLYVVNPGEKGLLAIHHYRLAEMLVVEVWDQNTLEELAAKVANFLKRLEACIAAYEGRLENLS